MSEVEDTPEAVEDQQAVGPAFPGSDQPSPTSETASEPSSAAASPSLQAKSKIEILLRATGDAPILKKKKWSVDKSKKIGWIIDFLKRLLKYDAQSDSLFVYINQSFAPAPDVEVGTLYDCFGADGKLVLHYCKTHAWG